MMGAVPLALALATLALVAAPFVDRALRRWPRGESFSNGAIQVLVGGLLLVHVLPFGLMTAGWPAVVALVIGIGAGLGAHRVPGGERWAGALVVPALLLHSAVDGVALAIHAGDDLMGWAVVLHSLPVGVAVWRISLARGGSAAAIGLLAASILATAAGWSLAGRLFEGGSPAALGMADCLVAGALLHVLGHLGERGEGRSGGWGALFGAGGLVVLATSHPIPRAMADELEAGATIANLLVEAAPALLLGYVAAGLLHAFAPSSLSRWLSGRSTIGASVRGALFGLPVPVCSCGALPLYRGLLARGAPPAAALAFLVAGPEVGASTLLVSVPLLGMHVTVLRLVAALAAAIMAGLLVGRMVGASPPADSPPVPRAPLRERLHEGLRFGLVETVDHTAPWVLAGLLLAGLIEPILTGDALHRLRGPLGVVSAALIGIPAYVCAAGATPLVAVLMHKGLSGGAAIAFLLTGPATNISTFGILRRLHGRPVAIWFGATVAGVAILLGWATDAIWPGLTAPTLHIAVEHTHGFLEQGSAAILVLLFGSALVRGGVAGFLHPLLHPLHEHSPTGACTHDHPHEHQPDPLPPAVPVVALSGYRFEAAASPSQGGVRGQSPCCHPHHGHDGCNGDHAKASPRPRRIAMGRFASRRSKEVGRAEEPPSEDKTD